MSRMIYKLVAYDRETERLVYAHRVPAEQVDSAKRAAGIDPDSRTAIGDWPLTAFQADAIAQLIGTKVDLEHLEFFLEPYVAAAPRPSASLSG
jgi:hypothetical protein